jgi:hypothetical protein
MKRLVFLLIPLAAVLTAMFLLPQTGSIRCQVLDPDTSAPIEGVEVVIEGDGVWVQADTDTAGWMEAANLPGGTYRIQFREPGFKKLELSDVQVQAFETKEIVTRLERKIHGCY